MDVPERIGRSHADRRALQLVVDVRRFVYSPALHGTEVVLNRVDALCPPIGARVRRAAGTALVALVAVAAVAAAGCAELSARRSVQQGNKLYADGKYELAIEQFERAIELAPHLAIAHHNCGLAHLKIFEQAEPGPSRDEHAKKAIQHFVTYLQSEPNDDKIISALVRLYVDSGDFDGAIAFWKKRLDASPGDTAAMQELALVSEKALRFDDALKWHRARYEAARTDEDRVAALSDIGNLQFRRLLSDKEAFGPARLAMADIGLGAFQEASRMQPQNEMLYSMQAALYTHRGLATDVAWARAVEESSALINRLKWRDLFTAKQKQAQAAADGSGKTGGGAPAGAGASQ
ncbi:MAG: tetratricopeptide repeat protein [Deltaproteobacteria bacterium]|nr:MAG: tetratricopeptide repeat protein [Deltaproteobacteria bacterium]